VTSYDRAQNPVRVTDAEGNATEEPGDGVTRYRYDALARVVGVDYADATPDVRMAYDPSGNITRMRDGFGLKSYAYDELDRPVKVARGAETFAYAYDPAGNVTDRSYPGGDDLRYAYDPDGLLESVSGAGGQTSYRHDAAGNLTRRALPNGYSERRGYDPAGRASAVRHERDGQTLSSFAYRFDSSGNPTEVRTEDGTEGLYLRRP